MIKLIIEINEEKTKDLKSFLLATDCKVEVVEKHVNPTRGEKVMVDYFRQKLDLINQDKIINKCKNKENHNIVEELKALLH